MDDTFDIEIEDQEESLSQAIQLPSNFLTIGEIEPDDVKVYIKQDVYKDLDKHLIFPSDGFKNEIKTELKKLGIEISSTTITFPQKQGEVQ